MGNLRRPLFLQVANKRKAMGVFIFKTWLEAKFIGSDRGAEMVEYGFLLALIAMVALAAVGLFGGKVSDKYSSISSSVS